MPADSATTEVAQRVHESTSAQAGLAVEVLEGLLLAVVAVLTAWSGYQSARWDSRSAAGFAEASRLRFSAQAADTLAGQQMLYDASTFEAWLVAAQAGNTQLEQFLEKRFRPEYRPAFDAWLATDPLNNPSAPAGPSMMTQYHNASSDQAAALNRQAATATDAANHSREVGDEYVRATVLLAVVLFLTALSQRFTIRRVRVGIIGLAMAALAFSLYVLATVAA